MYFNTFNKTECCGCTACEQICPKNVIKMVKDEEGFLFPSIDKNACIDCGLCERICPMENPQYENEQPITLAAYLKDISERSKSSSGGLFYAIARYVISQGGIVYGAAFDKSLQVHHICADTLERVQLLRGSKYLQSDLGTIFKNVKKNLQSGRLCYFTGTPCQVAGLKKYLQKGYDNLLTSDLLCHGVPNQVLFNEQLAYIRKNNGGDIIDYGFRSKKAWGVGEFFTIRTENGKQKKMESLLDYPYLSSFMKGMTFRYSCYECPFARLPRQGDITLGDYWGIQKHCRKFDTRRGVSVVLLNNTKGRTYWEEVRSICEYAETPIEWAIEMNKNIVSASPMHLLRKDIFHLIKEKGYEAVSKQYLLPKNLKLLQVKSRIRRYLSKVKKIVVK